jgi:rhomboid family GlyGly-CTERM serine protease
LKLSALLACGAVAGAWASPDALNWQPTLAWSQPWRWFTAAWIHLGMWHLGANLVGLALIALLGVRASTNASDALAWLLAWPLTHLALLLQPSLVRYAGLSGVLHAGVVIVGVRLLRGSRGSRRGVGTAILAGVALKLLLEEPWRGPLRSVAHWDFAVAPAAHVAGAAAGGLCALLLARGGRRGPQGLGSPQ